MNRTEFESLGEKQKKIEMININETELDACDVPDQYFLEHLIKFKQNRFEDEFAKRWSHLIQIPDCQEQGIYIQDINLINLDGINFVEVVYRIYFNDDTWCDQLVIPFSEFKSKNCST